MKTIHCVIIAFVIGILLFVYFKTPSKTGGIWTECYLYAQKIIDEMQSAGVTKSVAIKNLKATGDIPHDYEQFCKK